MSTFFQYRIHRADLRANPNVLYVFGDNLRRLGMGGQAGEMRNEPNAFGFATKRAPGMRKDDFLYDDMYSGMKISNELVRLKARIEAMPNFEALCLPLEGVGTGLSEMPMRAPKLFLAMCEEFAKLIGKPVPW